MNVVALTANTPVDTVGDVVSEISIAPVAAGMRQLIDVMGDVWSVMTANPLLCVFLGGSLLSMGIWVFRKVKRAAKG